MPEAKPHFKILTSNSLDKLTEKIQDSLDAGYALHGEIIARVVVEWRRKHRRNSNAYSDGLHPEYEYAQAVYREETLCERLDRKVSESGLPEVIELDDTVYTLAVDLPDDGDVCLYYANEGVKGDEAVAFGGRESDFDSIASKMNSWLENKYYTSNLRFPND
jgi:hypothetical protein